MNAAQIALSADAMYRILVHGVVDYAIFMLDPNGIVVNWNIEAHRTKGYSADDVVGTNFERFYTAEERALDLPRQNLAAAALSGSFESEGWRVRRDGERFWANVVINAIRDTSGTLLGFAKIVRDRSEQKRQADELHRNSEILKLALDNMSQGLVLFDGDEKLAVYNTRSMELLGGRKLNYCLGSSLTDVVIEVLRSSGTDPEQIPALASDARKQFLAKLRSSPSVLNEEFEFNNRVLGMSYHCLPGGGWLCTMEDVTERRLAERRIAHLAEHDILTGLLNRAAIEQAVAKISDGEGVPRYGILLYLDLDHFKPVNDSLGHAAGDHVLRTVAERIRIELRKDDIAARLGGDEFAIVAFDCEDVGASDALAARIIRSIARPIWVEGSVVRIGVSIGIAVIPDDGVEVDTLLHRADLALYRAKQTGRSRACLYEPVFETQKLQRSLLERELREALVAQAFTLVYQPVFGVDAGVIIGFEALIRWTSPSQGARSPDEFVPFAEEIGLMPEIDDWVLQRACADAVGWPNELTVSVNVSPTQFRRPGLSDRVAEALTASGLPAARLELEITETAAIHNVEEASRTLRAIRLLGVGVALDDFGTGHSSLSLLRTMPFTRIKIDRSFVQDLGTNAQSAAIVHAICDLCRSLGVRATAEGVETYAQAQRLIGEGCTELQGYLYGKPLPLEPGSLAPEHH